MSENEYEYCHEHERYERTDDRIDFPCSDTWLGYYHERGLTQRRPMDYMQRIVEKAATDTYQNQDELTEALIAIRKTMDTMNKAIVMRQEPRRRTDSAPPVREVTGQRPISKPIEGKPKITPKGIPL